MNILRIAFFGLPLLWSKALLGVPLPPIGPVDVEGRIEKAVWVPEERLKGRPGLSGSLGRDRTIPAHFLITLADYQGVEPPTARALTRCLTNRPVGGSDPKEKPPFLLLKIHHEDRRLLKAGMRVRIKGYTIRGDEGGTWTSYQVLEILRP
jgi:hypothetical protein